MQICCMQTLHRQISGDSPVEQSIKLVLDTPIIPADPTLTLSINIAQKPHILGPLGPKALIYIYIYISIYIYIYIYIYYMRVLRG